MRESATQIARSKGVWLTGAIAAAGLTFAALPHGVATPVEFSGSTRTATINASRDAVWYGQMNPTRICALLPACTKSTMTRTGYRLTMLGNVPGIGTVSQDVDAVVTKQIRPRLYRMRLTATSDLGSMNATMAIRLKAKAAQKTTVIVHVAKATGTGPMGTVILPFLAQNLTSGLTQATSTLNTQRKAAGITVQAHRMKNPKKIRVTTQLKNPGVQPAPTAKGKLRILTKNNKILCQSKMKKSQATCTLKGTRKPQQALITGTYTNGFPLWHSTAVKKTPPRTNPQQPDMKAQVTR